MAAVFRGSARGEAVRRLAGIRPGAGHMYGKRSPCSFSASRMCEIAYEFIRILGESRSRFNSNHSRAAVIGKAKNPGRDGIESETGVSEWKLRIRRMDLRMSPGTGGSQRNRMFRGVYERFGTF